MNRRKDIELQKIIFKLFEENEYTVKDVLTSLDAMWAFALTKGNNMSLTDVKHAVKMSSEARQYALEFVFESKKEKQK